MVRFLAGLFLGGLTVAGLQTTPPQPMSRIVVPANFPTDTPVPTLVPVPTIAPTSTPIPDQPPIEPTLIPPCN